MKLSVIAILERVYNTPLMATPEKLAVVCGVLNSRYGLTVEDVVSVELRADLLASAGQKMATVSDRGYVTNDSGVAFVPVMGTLCHRSGGMMAPESGMMCYDGIRNMFRAAMADPAVNEIVLDVNSHGGEVHGVFDLADEIYQARGTKAITALINEVGASAAYLVASAADRIIMPESAIAGSVGVVARHMDVSKLNEKEGVKVTYIHAGAKKVDGNPDEPLTDSAAAEIQANVDKTYSRFCFVVARNRGMDEAAVRATEAGVFRGSDAVRARLVDRVAPAATVYQFGGRAVDAWANSNRPDETGENNAGDTQMFALFAKMLGMKTRDGETDEQAAARFQALSAVFPNDPETVKAEFAAGHGVPEAVQTLRDAHLTALNARADEFKAANDALVKAQAELADAHKLNASLKDVAKDKESRPVVVVGADAGAAAGSDLEAQYKAEPKLAEEFGNFEAFRAYMVAAGSGRARILAAKKTE